MNTKIILTILINAIFLSTIFSQNVKVEAQIIEAQRTNYSDCFGCGSPDPAWVISGYVGSSLNNTSTLTFEGMSGTNWAIGYNGCNGPTPCSIVDNSNTSSLSFVLGLDAWENDCDPMDEYNSCFLQGDEKRCTNNSLTTVNFRTSAAFCVASNSSGWTEAWSAWCGNFRVKYAYRWSFASAPTFTTQPTANTSLCLGSTTTLSVAVNSDATSGISYGQHYQWQISENTACTGATNWLDISGATSATYTPQQISGTRLYRCKVTSNCTADFNSQTSISNCSRVTYNRMNGTSGTGIPYATGDNAPDIQTGICGSVVLPGSVHLLNTLQPPVVNAVNNVSYSWSATGGTFSTTSTSNTTWTAPNTVGSYTINLVYGSACGNESVSCTVAVGLPDCDFVYIDDATGIDAPTNGGPSNPMKTLKYALDHPNGKTEFRITGGSYSETSIVYINNNYFIDGGWKRTGNKWEKTNSASSANTTNLTFTGTGSLGNSAHVLGFRSSSKSNWILQDLKINTGNSSGTRYGRGKSNYGIHINNSSNYSIVRCYINTGNATSGNNGGNGNNGNGGGNGSQGEPGRDRCGGDGAYNAGGSAGSGGAGGTGAQNGQAGSSGATGGRGAGDDDGAGDYGGSTSCASGGAGSPRSSGTTYGAAGGTCNTPGANGSNGGTVGFSFSTYFIPGYGNNGTRGLGGGGGAGGGGGGENTKGCDASGNAGSGGGGGGGGGGSGYGGKGGGSSYGIYIYSNGVGSEIVDSYVGSGYLGNGGSGGSGGSGGAGGNGGAQHNGCWGCGRVNRGGAGGNGSAGGNGGSGGNAPNGERKAVRQTGGSIPALNGTSSAITLNNSTSGGSVPQGNGSIVEMKAEFSKGCTNSQIKYAKTGGGAWNLGFSQINLINDLNTNTSSFTASNANITGYYSNTGIFGISRINGWGERGYFIRVTESRPVPIINISPSTICIGGNVNLNHTNPYGTELEYSWRIYNTPNATGVPIFQSTDATPSIGPFTTAGTYLVQFQVREECCGWSKYVYGNITVNPDPSPVLTATRTPSGPLVCLPENISLTVPGGVTGGISPYVYEYSINIPSTGSWSAWSGTNSTAAELGTNSIRVRVAEDASKGCDASVELSESWDGDNPPTPGNTTADQNVCYNTIADDFLLTGYSGGTPSYWEISSSNTFSSVTTIATTSALLPGSSVPSSYLTSTYYVRSVVDNAACPEEESSYATITVNTPTTIATTELTEVCNVNDNVWVHIYNKTTGKIVASINSHGQNLGDVTMKDYLHSNLSVPTTGQCIMQQAVMDRSYVINSVNSPSGNVSLRLYFTDAELASLIDRSLATQSTGGALTWSTHDPNGCADDDDVLSINDLYVTQVSDPGNEDNIYDGTSGTITIHNTTNNGTGNMTFGGNYVQFDVTGFSEFWIHGSEHAVALPVELLDFNVITVNNKEILLDWQTATEINNDGFEVQRSTDGINFNKISWIKGFGNTNSLSSYKYLDQKVSIGTYYYRLKQIDFDGQFEYSQIKSASILGKEGFGISFFIPNPTKSNAVLEFNLIEETEVLITVYNTIGKLVDTKKLSLNAGIEKVNFNTEKYANGIYTAKIIINKEEFVRKLLVNK